MVITGCIGLAMIIFSIQLYYRLRNNYFFPLVSKRKVIFYFLLIICYIAKDTWWFYNYLSLILIQKSNIATYSELRFGYSFLYLENKHQFFIISNIILLQINPFNLLVKMTMISFEDF